MSTKNIPFFSKENQYKNLKVKLKSGLEVTLKQEIGQGAFSNVYSTSNERYVAKIMNLQFDPALQSFNNEKKYLEQLGNHQNLIEYVQGQKIVVNQGELGFLIIENCPKGSLVDIMKRSPKQQLSEQQILRVIYEVANGLNHIHKKGFAHRDIKIENILFAEDGKYKICDFGSMTNDLILKIGTRNILELEEEVKKNTTPLYRAPEQSEPSLFKDSPLAEKVDIFALGVLGYILCYKKPPFESALGAISCSTFWPDLPVVSDEFQGLLKKMFAPNPTERPSATEVCEIIIKELNLDYENDGIVDRVIFKKGNDKEAKPSFFAKVEKMIVGAFYDTQGWIKGSLLHDEYGPQQKYVRKLLLKAWEKREKTDKFYLLLSNHWNQKENKSNTIVNLKLLTLLHNYFKKGPPEAMTSKSSRKVKPNKIIKDIIDNWESIIKQKGSNDNSDQKRNIFSSKLIINLSHLLEAKLNLNGQYSEYIEGNFSLNPFLQSASGKFKKLDPQMLFDLFDYLANLLGFSSANLLQVGHLWNIQACIALSVLDEMYCLLCLIMHLYRTFKVSTNYESFKFDASLINPFVQEQDSKLKKMYLQVIKFAKRCSQIAETATQVASVIPQLNPEAVSFIQEISILTNKSGQFNIFEYLNYNINICGLKIPLSYGYIVLDAAKSSYPSVQSSSSSDGQSKKSNSTQKQSKNDPVQASDYALGLNDEFEEPIYQTDSQVDMKDFKEFKQKMPSDPPKNQSKGTKTKVNQQTYVNNQQLPSEDIFNQIFSAKDTQRQNNQKEAENAFDQFTQFQIAPDPKKTEDFFVSEGAVISPEEEKKQNYAFDTSHPSLIRPDRPPDHCIPSTSKETLFDVKDLSKSINKNKNQEQTNIYDFYNQGNQTDNNQFFSQNPNQIVLTQSDINTKQIFNQNNNEIKKDNNQQAVSFNPFDSFFNSYQKPIEQQQSQQPQFFDPFGDMLAQQQKALFEQQIQQQQQLFQQQQQQQQQQQLPQVVEQNMNGQLQQGLQQVNQFQFYQQQQLLPQNEEQGQNYQWQQNNYYQQNFQNPNYFQAQGNNQSNYNQNQVNFYQSQQQQQFQNYYNQGSPFQYQGVSQQQQWEQQQQQLQQQQLQYQMQHQPELIQQNNFKQNKENENQQAIQQQLLWDIQSQQQYKDTKGNEKQQQDMYNQDPLKDIFQKNKIINELQNKNAIQDGEEAFKECENVPDDYSSALQPLNSFVALQKGIGDLGNAQVGSVNNQEQGQQKKELEELYLNQLQLIRYIKNAVSSEFYQFIVDFSEFTVGQSIGSGNSCQVYKGNCKGKEVAVKVIKLDSSDELHLKEFQREIQALIQLKNHQNLLQLVAISSNENNFYIITEFCQGGTLFDLLHRKKKEVKFILWNHKLQWLKHISYGMTYLHKSRLIHRDLKSLNLLFDIEYDPNSNQVPNMKVADFGLTRSGSYTNNPHQSGAIGTFHWMAPEIIMNQPSTTKSDVYSFAVVMWELCTRQTPYKEFKTPAFILRYVTDQKGRPDLTLMPFDTPKGVGFAQFLNVQILLSFAKLKELMILCWDEDPKKRPSFDQIIEMLDNLEAFAVN